MESDDLRPSDGIELNGRRYARPRRPVVVVCIDGGDPAYLEDARARGLIPNIARFMEQGFAASVRGTVPSFTNPNNLSIVTGAPPAVHGISGNFYLDRESGDTVMMTDPALLRSETLLATFSRAGVGVAAITAKDKLRAQLAHGLDFGRGAICFSAQCADRARRGTHGMEGVLEYVGWPLPDMYSAELSLFVLEAGVKLLSERRVELLYLSLTDYVQHKHAPGEPESDRFHRAVDDACGRLAELGAIVAVTADHGMSDKTDAAGAPKVVWLQDVLDDALGPGRARVICPITDPFVAHHGALGGFVRIYCAPAAVPEVMRIAAALEGVEEVMERGEAAARFELPFDREGDVVVVSDRGTAIGGAERDHDLSGLAGHRLRTHGGVSEATVPFVLSHPLDPAHRAEAARGGLRSHDIFRFALNGCVSLH